MTTVDRPPAAPPPIRPAPRMRPPGGPPRPPRQPRPSRSGPSLGQRLGPWLRDRFVAWFSPTRGREAAAGRQSAGRALGVIVTALALAAVVNADALVERADRKPLGPGRDRSLALWHPVQDLAQVLQVHWARTLGDAIAGDDDPPAVPVTTAPPGPAGPATIPPRPELRTPTAAAPLRLWVGGDSMMRDLSESVERLTADDPLLDSTTHYEISSGLARPDYYNWPAVLAGDMETTNAEVAVIMFGANDGQGLIAADGTTYQRVTDGGWQREYAARVGAVMDQLHANGRIVLWVLQPPMRDADFDARIDIINDLYRAAAEDRPWVDIVETDPLFGDSQGAFADRLADVDGDLEDLRQDDGIHLARAGADKLASHLLDRIEDELEP